MPFCQTFFWDLFRMWHVLAVPFSKPWHTVWANPFLFSKCLWPWTTYDIWLYWARSKLLIAIHAVRYFWNIVWCWVLFTHFLNNTRWYSFVISSSQIPMWIPVMCITPVCYFSVAGWHVYRVFSIVVTTMDYASQNDQHLCCSDTCGYLTADPFYRVVTLPTSGLCADLVDYLVIWQWLPNSLKGQWMEVKPVKSTHIVIV